MKDYICDRCGDKATHEVAIRPQGQGQIWHRTVDLCWACKAALDVFLEADPQGPTYDTDPVEFVAR